MQFLTRLIAAKRSLLLMTLLALSLMVAGCVSPAKTIPPWPTNLDVIEMSDGGVCLDRNSAVRLAEYKADLEAL